MTHFESVSKRLKYGHPTIHIRKVNKYGIIKINRTNGESMSAPLSIKAIIWLKRKLLLLKDEIEE